MLEKLLVAAEAGKPDEALKAIEDRHRLLLTELGLEVSPQLQGYFDELRQVANGIALVRELSDRTRARVMANGELMATEIGSRFLKQQGVDVTWSGRPRHVVRRRPGRFRQGVGVVRDLFVRPRCRAREKTRGRHAGGDHPGLHRAPPRRRHRLLGRGGSDTSAAYFGALLRARGGNLDRRARHVQRQSARSSRRASVDPRWITHEAQEIATTGAKVLHPRSIKPCRDAGVPMAILDTERPELPGTSIDGDAVTVPRSQGDQPSQRHRAGVDGSRGHVAAGRLPGRCVRALQASRHCRWT